MTDKQILEEKGWLCPKCGNHNAAYELSCITCVPSVYGESPQYGRVSNEYKIKFQQWLEDQRKSIKNK